MSQPKIHAVEYPQGTVYLLQEGNQFTPVTPVQDQQGLNGLFSKGGPLDKVISTVSGVFKKQDGSPTFIGESVKEVANQFGTQLANNLAQQQQFSQQVPTWAMPGLQQPQQPTQQLPAATTQNPLQEKDNTVLYAVLGTLAAAGIGTGIYFATKKSK